MWPNARANEIANRLIALRQKTVLSFTFVPSESTLFKYFPSDLSTEFRSLQSEGFEYIPPTEPLTNCDIAIITAHGSDLSAALWKFRQFASNTLIAVWLWDNHICHAQNLQTTLATDLIFASHQYQLEYLINPVSILALHVPACSAQWTKHQASEIFAGEQRSARSNKILANYVDYEFSWRSSLLRRMKTELPEAEVILMSPNDRSRYFGKNSAERFEEWLGYKAALVLPFDQDLSTRVFDGLLAGQIIIAPQTIPDFDKVIPPDLQRRLGILRLPDLDMSTIRKFAWQAINTFDEAGEQGVRERHQYAIKNHMLVNRVKMMLEFIKKTSVSKMTPIFYGDQQGHFGLHLVGAYGDGR